MNARRLSGLATWLPVPAAGLLWASSRMEWASVSSEDGLTAPRVDVVSGAAYSALPAAIAVALLASVAALVAVRGRAVALTAVLVGALAVVAALPAVRLGFRGLDAERAAKVVDLPGRAEVTAVQVASGGPAVALLGAVFALVASVVLIGTSRLRRGLSSRFDRSAPAAATARGVEARSPGEAEQPDATARPLTSPKRESATEDAETGPETGKSAIESGNTPNEPQSTERELWEALDAGEDPTV